VEDTALQTNRRSHTAVMGRLSGRFRQR